MSRFVFLGVAAMAAFAAASTLAAAEPKLPPDTVVAKRGGATISLREIDAKMAEAAPSTRAHYLENPQRIEQTVSDLLLVKQMAKEGRESGLERSAEYKATMALVSERILATLRGEQLVKSAPKLDAEAVAKESYLTNPERFRDPDTLTVRHILVRTGPGCRSEAQARELAEKLHDQAAAGKDFAELARGYSEDETTRDNGGLLPKFGKGKMQKPFEDAAFALKEPGAVSPVIKTGFGFHVIDLVERKAGTQHSFEEVRADLIKQVTAEHIERFRRDHLDQLRSMSIEASPEALQSLRTRYADAEDLPGARDDKAQDPIKSMEPAPGDGAKAQPDPAAAPH